MIIQQNSNGTYVCGYVLCSGGLVPQNTSNGTICVCPVGYTNSSTPNNK